MHLTDIAAKLGIFSPYMHTESVNLVIEKPYLVLALQNNPTLERVLTITTQIIDQKLDLLPGQKIIMEALEPRSDVQRCFRCR